MRWLFVAAALLACAAACSGTQGALRHGEGLDAQSLPADVRPDYAVFADRCSKCHSLARSLESGIEDDVFWARYVTRMKRQPASGISDEDEVVILRFLHYYSAERRKKKAGGPQGAAAPEAGEQAAGRPGGTGAR